MEHHEWGWMIVVYLFLGGLGAGCMVLSGAAHLGRRGRYQGIARAGAILAPILVGVGSGLLIFDLGNPLRFWRLFVTFQPTSPMFIGSWLLIGFSLVTMIYAVLQLPPSWLRSLAGRFPKGSSALETLATWNKPAKVEVQAGKSLERDQIDINFPHSPKAVRRLRSAMAGIGIPLGLGVGIYTGVLLGAIPARPFWNTPMVAQLFLFSALSTAAALLMLVTPLVFKGDASHSELQHRSLLRADLIFIFLELFIIIPYIIHGELSVLSAKESLGMILGGPYTGPFWVGVVLIGILIPAAVELVEASVGIKKLPVLLTRGLHFVVPVMILVGGYLLRWVFVHAGQDTAFL
ncbi:MAG: polysulfide reductase NrfD [Acidobacteria bacterium]|uniref:Polysulfide reductase NrfD n=1 Tax=Candidatus Polarisedimenticola svalbardensis TaxID=2886004 RepID=A0A8J6XUN1_9BACT|nr:polysulfide reductase NrfD [Candidatus Polarisedimenticola svalbardensis]